MGGPVWDAFYDIHMGMTAENIAETYGISREEEDAYPVENLWRGKEAIENGRFTEEIIPVSVPQKEGEAVSVFQDEFLCPGTIVDGLAKLKPAF